MCWCPPRCGAPLRPPRGVVCPPVVGACPVCCPPPAVGSCPVCWCPPAVCCGPDRDHCYDCLEATAAPHRIHSLAPWRHQGSGHPHAYGSCVRRAGTVHAIIHSPQQAFSQQSSAAAASRSRATAPLPTVNVYVCIVYIYIMYHGARARAGGTCFVAVLHAASVIGCWGRVAGAASVIVCW